MSKKSGILEIQAITPKYVETLEDLVAWFLPRYSGDRSCPLWPPDVFGICAAILNKTGGYARAVTEWPPSPNWVKEIKLLGKEWHQNYSQTPHQVQIWWDALQNFLNVDFSQLRTNEDLSEVLIQLLASADEASFGAGILHSKSDAGFYFEADQLLVSDAVGGATLCREIHWSKLRVLPKQHTPRDGLTIRSMSHHLALCLCNDVTPRWHTALTADTHSLNLLLIPWPEKVTPSQFVAMTPPTGALENMNKDQFGFFRFQIGSTVGIVKKFLEIVERAEDTLGSIDGVILPELCLPPDAYDSIRTALRKKGCFLISGIAGEQSASSFGQNSVGINIPPMGSRDAHPTSIQQHKHHRWRLDRNQIVQYALGGRLDPTKCWWEAISLDPREINFITLKEWLTLCALVCEDLARPDPIADIVRAVGPNLVVALLMDGPQLTSRWPARYATVLADDPGCSVLTLSSLGMVNLCNAPPGKTQKKTIALWKDARSRETVEIELPEKKEAVAITLSRSKRTEYSADGRDDEGETAYLMLSGTQFI